MSRPKPKSKPVLSRAEVLLVRLCLFLAFGISVYLAWSSFQGGAIPGCGPESDCDKVLSSRWGYLFGLPVSLFAAPVYAGLLVLLWQKNLKWPTLVAASTVILMAALWFVSVQFFALRAFCKFCMTAHVAGVIAALVLLRRNPIAAGPTMGWSVAGAAAVGLLVAAQFAFEPPSSATVTYTASTGEPAGTGIAAPISAPVPTFTILQGQVVLDLTEVPVHGRKEAPKKVVKLFDYTCHHCRDMHHHFQPLLQTYSNQLAVISLVMPIDGDCNPMVKRTPPSHEEACDYAKLGLAVFYAAPEKSHQFDDWIFEPAKPPPLPEARRFAENLVGADALGKALIDPRIGQRIQENIHIYSTNSRMVRSGKMPQLLFTDGSTVGASLSVPDLEKMLAQGIGLQTNQPAGDP